MTEEIEMSKEAMKQYKEDVDAEMKEQVREKQLEIKQLFEDIICLTLSDDEKYDQETLDKLVTEANNILEEKGFSLVRNIDKRTIDERTTANTQGKYLEKLNVDKTKMEEK